MDGNIYTKEIHVAVGETFASSDLQAIGARASLVSEDLKALVKKGFYDHHEDVKEAVEKWAFELERIGQTVLEIKAEFWRLTQTVGRVWPTERGN